MHKVWIEAALNGPWSREYDGGGAQTYDWQVYARIIEGIRNQVDVPVYPSFEPLMISDLNAGVADPSVRQALAAMG
jgi:3-keto-5-aminohexanoate cleavage enzyme